ncbi:SDR family NAD(P)-dependent oxidoreductase [Dactylosporangium sp. NPDC051484]|uniref:SDR family NAD(P)-dependent oxidoreductase n=1 Tax=Dactylosporangium sp. NPDC051484 TaxID=3154942 RepID=UPI00344F3998
MQNIIVSGGNSGIGLESARSLLQQGHHVVILGRDPRKGKSALASFGATRERASFVQADLSTHDGVRQAARELLTAHERYDAILHTTGVMTFEDLRTADGLHPFFTVNYLSRYHLTQLLLPALRHAEHPRVVMMTAHVPLTTRIDMADFPQYTPFSFTRMRKPIQIANHHYAAHLAATEPGLLTGVVNAGTARTDIFRMQPRWMRATATVLGPLFFDSIDKAAHNAINATGRQDWPTRSYWRKTGDFSHPTPISLDASQTSAVIAASRNLTSA